MINGPVLLVMLLVAIFLFAGLIVLQCMLSKVASGLAGLILPSISLVVAIAFSVPNFIEAFRVSFSMGALLASVLILAVYNIPTVVFVLIYAYKRRKFETARQLSRMKIQDL